MKVLSSIHKMKRFNNSNFRKVSRAFKGNMLGIDYENNDVNVKELDLFRERKIAKYLSCRVDN